ncbi:putative endoglucanase [mine drainage metagenome]|uniref:Putative endoglucanase n=1 Tax=mine drainage metagenome TaxID=410659 RepID=A0A1J5R3P0_9ZZZZ
MFHTMPPLVRLLLTSPIALAMALPVVAQCASSPSNLPWLLHGRIQVSKANPHYLEYQDGTRFWWFADTAWELPHRTTREQVDLYLANRAKLGFNVIQAVALGEFLKGKDTNAYGYKPLVDWNPLKPDLSTPENYWTHLDYIVEAARKRGLYIALLPTWGEWVIPREGKPLFNTPEQAYGYGNFIGARYRNAPNIIWILGGDRLPDERPNGIELWRAMAKGIADGVNGTYSLNGKTDYSTTLMTYHCFESSSKWFHNDPWIDFDTWGSYHAEFNNTRAFEQARHDWNLPSPRPFLDSEPCYEDALVNYAIPGNGHFKAVDVRIAAYWSVFSGACGFTYGADAIWQFADAEDPPLTKVTRDTWYNALAYDGARQVIYLKNLLLSRPSDHLRPDQSLILKGAGEPAHSTVVLRGDSHLFAYIPTGNDLTLKLGVLTGKTLKASWFNPRTGTSQEIGLIPNEGEHTFQVPPMSSELTWLRTGRGCDWVLVLDDDAKGYPAPGEAK